MCSIVNMGNSETGEVMLRSYQQLHAWCNMRFMDEIIFQNWI